MKTATCRNLLRTIVTLATLASAMPAQAESVAQADTPAAAPKPKRKPKKKPAPPPADEPKPASADEPKPDAKPVADDGKPAAEAAEGKPAGDDKKPEETAKAPGVDITDTREDPNTRYYFVGLRYRGTVIPQFLMNIFVDEGTTVFSNMFGAELDMRKGGQTMMPWLVYSDYGTGDMLFHQKGSDTAIAGNYSVVHSSLKMLILGLDELWSVPIDDHHHWDFEFGFGVGLGIVFGDLQNNWVTPSTMPTNLKASTGVYYQPCQTMGSGRGCSTADHQNAQTAKVGGYKEAFWFSGGSVPNIFPNVWFPTLGVRYKPIKQFQARVGVGFSLTGFWFGLSGDYGLESTDDKGVKASGNRQRMRDML